MYSDSNELEESMEQSVAQEVELYYKANDMPEHVSWDQEHFINAYISRRSELAVPLFGTRFLLGVAHDAVHIPSMQSLVLRILELADKDAGVTSNDRRCLHTFHNVGDHTSLISLVLKRAINVERIFEHAFDYEWTRSIQEEHIQPYQILIAGRWPVVASSNIDGLLEFAYPNEQQASYASREISGRFEGFLGSISNDTLVLRLIGRWRDSLARSLVTWEDLFTTLRLPDEFNLSLIDSLVATADREVQNAYREALNTVLPVKNTVTDYSSPFLAFVDNLLSSAELLMFGINEREPMWQLFCWRLGGLTSDATGENFRHFLFSPSPFSFLPPRVKHVTLRDEELSRLMEGMADKHVESVPGEEQETDRRYTDIWELYTVDEKSSLPWCYIEFSDVPNSLKGPTSLLPFTELWSNLHGGDGRKEILITLPSTLRYKMSGDLTAIREGYWKYRELLRQTALKPEPQVNEVKVRVNSARIQNDGALCLEIEPVEYKDYLVTNHFVSNMSEREVNVIASQHSGGDSELADNIRNAFTGRDQRFSPRHVLCGSAESLRLKPEAKCSNHLGASMALIADYEPPEGGVISVVLCAPSGNQISSPAELIPIVSGSFDWPLAENATDRSQIVDITDLAFAECPTKQFSVLNEILREFHEECLGGHQEIGYGSLRMRKVRQAVQYAESLLANIELVNLCQNIQRGGKPELFYVASLRFSANYFLRHVYRPNWELKPAWRDISGEEIWKYRLCAKSRLVQLFPSPLDPSFALVEDWKVAANFLLKIVRDNKFNHVLRASILSILRYCHLHCPERFGEWVQDKGLFAYDV